MVGSFTVSDNPGVKDAGFYAFTEARNTDASAVHTARTDAPVIFTDGAAGVVTRIDLVTVAVPAYITTVSGPGVTFSTHEGQPTWCVEASATGRTCRTYSPSGTAQSGIKAGLYLNGNKMYQLWPEGTSYRARTAFTKV